MNGQFSSKPLAEQQADALLVFTFLGAPLLPRPDRPASRRLARMVKEWIRSTGYGGKAGDVSIFPTWDHLPVRMIILAGLGRKEDFHAGRLDQAAATAARQARKLKLRSLATTVGGTRPTAPMEPPRWVHSVAIGISQGGYQIASHDGNGNSSSTASIRTIIFTDAPAAPSALAGAYRRARQVADSLTDLKHVANRPGNEATPAFIARVARRLAAQSGLRCQVWNEAELKRQRCHALLAVGQGSRNRPAMILLRYPGRRRRARPIVLVGKTITFDTGGISLKPSKGMEWMKFDKCGGMAVLAAMRIIGKLKPAAPVIGILAAAENMPGGQAIRPGDIISSRAGKTIEVLNTDAEGRLVLADALAVAAGLHPACIIDLATLTGAVIVALGHLQAAVLGTSDKLVNGLCRAGAAAGERLHPLPLLPEHGEALRSSFADLKNIAADGFGAGTIIGAAFLKEFVPAGIPWAHLDIAGTAWEEGARPHTAPGATLFGARLLVEWILNQDAP
jgi:leucyl aminopeptidase